MLLDIAIGVLGAVFFAATRHTDLSGPLLFAGVLFAILPDADFLWQAFRRRGFSRVESSHRYVLHAPLVYIPLGTAAVAFFDPPLAALFAALSFAHFAHDSVLLGLGVRWLYPFSQRAYKFFSDADGNLSWNLMVSWSAEEEAELEARINPHKNWFRRVYLRPHVIGIVEHALTLIFAAVIIALLLI